MAQEPNAVQHPVPELVDILNDEPQPFNSRWSIADHEEHVGHPVTKEEFDALVTELEDGVLSIINDWVATSEAVRDGRN